MLTYKAHEPFLIIRSVPVSTTLSVVTKLSVHDDEAWARGAFVDHHFPLSAFVAGVLVVHYRILPVKRGV